VANCLLLISYCVYRRVHSFSFPHIALSTNSSYLNPVDKPTVLFFICQNMPDEKRLPAIVVIGSSNTDMVIKTAHLPAPGETILGGTFFMNAGGKGANQAVAAARLGGAVTFIAKVGNDIFGKEAVQLFEKEGIDTTFVVTDPEQPSGVALITVDERGENCIAVASGANAALRKEDIESALSEIENAGVILLQLEVPLASIIFVAEVAAKQRKRVILNPAPACPLPDALYPLISIITPNETEAAMLTGINITDDETATKAATLLRQKGVETVIITLGAKGALVLHEENIFHVPSIPVDAVDTTAAGDVFNGALAVAVAEGREISEAVSFACKAAAISVTRLGAQASAPYRSDVERSILHENLPPQKSRAGQ
jgi:ribokinase